MKTLLYLKVAGATKSPFHSFNLLFLSPAFVRSQSLSVYLWFLCENFSSPLPFLSHRSSSSNVLTFPFFSHIPSAAPPSALWVCVCGSVLAECVPALVALTGPDNSRSAFICQPLHLSAAQSRGELAALFVLSPSGDRPAIKGSSRVYSRAMSALSHTSTTTCTLARVNRHRTAACSLFDCFLLIKLNVLAFIMLASI